MNKIQLFSNPDFGNLRVIKDGDEPMFVAADVCKALDHTNVTIALARLDDDEKTKLNLGLSGGSTNVVTFPGLLSLILGSRKPEAKAYKRWVTHEVLPSIHRNGGYIANQENATPEQILANAMLVANNVIEEQKTQLAHQQESIDQLKAASSVQHKEIARLNGKVKVMEPKAMLAEAVIEGHGNINVADLSAILQQVPGTKWRKGRNTLHKQLLKDGHTRRNRSGHIVPTQRSIQKGILEVAESYHFDSKGNKCIDLTTMVTPKGQQFFVERYAGVKEVA